MKAIKSHLPLAAAHNEWQTAAPPPARRGARAGGSASGAASRARAGRNVTPLRPVVQPGVQLMVRPGVQFRETFVRSQADAMKFARTTIAANEPVAQRALHTRDLVHTATALGDAAQRRVLAKAFTDAKSELLLVQHISELPAEQAGEMMKDYLAAGGSLAPVLQWLELVGSAIAPATVGRRIGAAKAAAKTGTAARAASRRIGFSLGDIGKWIKDTAKSVGNAIVNAVNSVVDAVVKAGKSLAQAFSDALNWTVQQITDLARALLRAGKGVVEILSAAATKGVAFLQKMVESLIAAGRTLAEVVGWAVGQAVATANAAIAKLIAMGRSLLDLVRSVTTAAASAMQAMVRGILAAGRTLAQLLQAVAGQVLDTVQRVLGALRALGQTVRALVVEAARQVAAAARTMLQALLNLGVALGELLAEAAAAAAATLQTVLRELMVLGRQVAQLLAAAAARTAAIVRSTVQALLALGRSVAEMVLAAVSQAVAVARSVFEALVALGRKVSEFLVALAGRAVSALRTALEALLAMGVTLVNLVKDICTDVVAGFRQGFFEGLVALGKGVVEILKAAAVTSLALLLLAGTVVIELFGGHRPLTDAEAAEARKVFGVSIDLARVKIAVASLPSDAINYLNGKRPFTSMYIINFARGEVITLQTLVHELTHVWQGVNTGALYMSRALEAQMSARLDSLLHGGGGSDAAAYRVTAQMLAAHAGDFSKFNPEQQATIVEWYWVQKFSGQPNGSLPAEAALEPYARQVFRGARGTAVLHASDLLSTNVRVTPGRVVPPLVRPRPIGRAAPASKKVAPARQPAARAKGTAAPAKKAPAKAAAATRAAPGKTAAARPRTRAAARKPAGT